MSIGSENGMIIGHRVLPDEDRTTVFRVSFPDSLEKTIDSFEMTRAEVEAAILSFMAWEKTCRQQTIEWYSDGEDD